MEKRKPDRLTLKKKWALVRDLWNEWDPIRVMDDPKWPRDEYDAYVWPTVSLLEKDASIEELAKYFRQTAEETMGRTSYSDPFAFAKNVKKAFQDHFTENSHS